MQREIPSKPDQHMKVFKFGGASVKNSEGVRNLARIVDQYGQKPLVTVVSAMGKTTNALEELTFLAFHNKDFLSQFEKVQNFHLQMVSELVEDPSHPIHSDVSNVLENLSKLLQNENYRLSYGMYYDQVVSQGEILSTVIVNHFLLYSGIQSKWFDAREVIKTDEAFREGKVDWVLTEKLVREKVAPLLNNSIVLTQGFIGSSLTNLTTTLGREGSDFTASIFATCLEAGSVTIWKDVPGILNADPKLIKASVKFDELSYNEAAEMTYYGAQVIHPKTIKPLANKKIPLFVKSFDHPEDKGTIIHDIENKNLPPTIVFKFNQQLISFHVKDLTFIDESNLSMIFHSLDRLNIKINLMQNSAVSFSICIDYNEQKISDLRKALQYVFDIKYNENLTLITVKNYDQKSIDELSEGKSILLEQRTRHTFQIVVSS
jgi:aspartate kinase